MIYFVDEDVAYINEFSVPLKIRGRDVTVLANADVAFEALINANDIELVIVDVMLATDVKEKSRFSRAETDDFLKTGLLLIADLVAQRPENFPKKIVVLTAASDIKLVRKIKEECGQRNIEILSKSDYSSPVELANKLEELIA